MALVVRGSKVGIAMRVRDWLVLVVLVMTSKRCSARTSTHSQGRAFADRATVSSARSGSAATRF